MKRVRVKICGITNEDDLEAAVEAGADALGFVVDVPRSPRNVSVDRAQELVETIPPFVQSVAVSVFQTLDQVRRLCSRLSPNAVQLAGALPRDDSICEHIGNVRLIRVVAVNDEAVFRETPFTTARCNAVLTDSYVPGAYGGTGMSHNWAVSRIIRERIAPIPLILAGGLTADNVQTAIETVRPYAVDVSTSVEMRPGVKDHGKIRKFIEAVAEASGEL